MSRDGSGNYTLPLPDVITGTTIESSWANTTLSDIETEMTDSLSRSGVGGMLAVLKLIDGAEATPALTWSSDADCGLYRAAADDVRMSVGGTGQMRWTATGVQVWEDATWKSLITYPSSASDNDTLRYNSGSGEWVANSNVTTTATGDLTAVNVTATGDLTAVNVTASNALASTAGQLLLNDQWSTLECAENLNLWSKRGVTTGDDNDQQEIILAVNRSPTASGVGKIHLGYTSTTGWGAELTLYQEDYTNPGSLDDKRIELDGGWVRILPSWNFEVDHDTHGKIIEYKSDFQTLVLGGNVSATPIVTIQGDTCNITTDNTEISGLPTSDPANNNRLWNDNGIVRVSDGVAADGWQTEGSFTPFIADSSLSASEGQTYNAQTGHYVRTGNLVWFNLVLNVSGIGTLTTTQGVRIGGLPFASDSSSPNGQGTFPVYATGMSVTAGQTMQANLVTAGDQHLEVVWWDAASGCTPLLFSDGASVPFFLEVTGTYKAG